MAAELNPAEVKACTRPTQFPIKFDDQQAEVGFACGFIHGEGSATCIMLVVRQLGNQARKKRPASRKPAAADGLVKARSNPGQAQVNFLALYHMLRFGSGYDPVLLQRCRRAAAETVQFGAIGMHLSAKRLDGPWMRAFNAYRWE